MACSKCDAKRKVDSEMIGLNNLHSLMCLICQETIAVSKSSNLKRCYEIKYRHFEDTFPQNSEVRATKINALKWSCQAASRLLVASTTQQQKATESSFRVIERFWLSTRSHLLIKK